MSKHFYQQELGSEAWLARLSAVTRALGRDSFAREFLELINRVTRVDQCTVFSYGPEGLAQLFTSGKLPSATAAALGADYVQAFHHRDPLYAQLVSGEQPSTPQLVPLDLRAYDAGYRRHFFERNDLIDKLATLTGPPGARVLCNFYRTSASGPYSAGDARRMRSVVGLLSALVAAHYRARRAARASAAGITSGERNRGLVHTIVSDRTAPFDRLTSREREVCARIVLGCTSMGISLELNIGLSSVLTYRKRAYAKLGISTQNQLFGLCLRSVRLA